MPSPALHKSCLFLYISPHTFQMAPQYIHDGRCITPYHCLHTGCTLSGPVSEFRRCGPCDHYAHHRCVDWWWILRIEGERKMPCGCLENSEWRFAVFCIKYRLNPPPKKMRGLYIPCVPHQWKGEENEEADLRPR